jgi:flavin-dependent dehydrogenase
VIVGAGPAGSSAAIRLANSGRSVLLIDKARFPRHKLCGEFVSPECLDHLNDLGVTPDVMQLAPPAIEKTIFHSSGSRSFSVASRWLAANGSDSIGLSRQSLDQLLLDRASACGATVSTETSVTEVSLDPDDEVHMTLRSADGSTHSVSTSTLIDATGRGRYIARRFDSSPVPTKPGQVAFKAHLRGAAIEAGTCEIYSYSGGYGGCSQVEGDLYNLCFVVDSRRIRSIGSDLRKVLAETVLKNRRAADALANIEVDGDWLTVPIARYGSMDPAPANGILAIGDAAAFIDPFTGSGISMALESSRLLSEAMVKARDLVGIADIYSRNHAATFERRLRVCRALRLLSGSPRIADAMIVGFATSERLRRLFARLTRGNRLSQNPVK